MINHNGTLQATAIHELNRGFLYGDAVFETLKVVNGRILFAEDHYFRLMASMRIMRMEIPMHFTQEFMEAEILKVLNAVHEAWRVRLTMYRDAEGYYLPKSRKVGFWITASPLHTQHYVLGEGAYEVELFKDFILPAQMLSSVKTNNRALNVLASIYAEENGYQNCLLLNEHKNVVEAINGNLFLVSGNRIVTPPPTEGCIRGIMRKQLLAIIAKQSDWEWEERPISPFELQKADELFITNVITGIQPITQYRKKNYVMATATRLNELLNASLNS